jgi:hypothetical protein
MQPMLYVVRESEPSDEEQDWADLGLVFTFDF